MLSNLFAKSKKERKLSLNEWLLISCGFSCILVVARIFVSGYNTYLFMPWNLFLAFVPYATSELLSRSVSLMEHKWKRRAVMALWLLFIPNTFYIVTDLFHLEEFDTAPKWFDLLLLFSFAWNGLMFGFLSIRKMAIIQQAVSGQRFYFLFIFAVMWLNSFGIYIGRYLRYNSWDIIAQPFSLFNELLGMIFNPLQNKMEWGMITIWAVFMTLIYFTIEKMAESFLLRYNKQLK